jgi:hypothetical protein
MLDTKVGPRFTTHVDSARFETVDPRQGRAHHQVPSKGIDRRAFSACTHDDRAIMLVSDASNDGVRSRALGRELPEANPLDASPDDDLDATHFVFHQVMSPMLGKTRPSSER